MRALAFLLMVGPAGAAVISGNIQDVTGTAYSPTIRFVPLSTPLANGPVTVLDVPRSAQLSNGAFAVSLVGGLYNVDFGPPNKPIRILVPPNDTNGYNFNFVANLATNVGTFSFTNTFGSIASRVLPGTNVLFATNNAGLANESLTISTPSQVRNSDQIEEGATNLYFLPSRAQASVSASAPLHYSAGLFSIPAANASIDGYLNSSDRLLFSAKENPLTFSSPLSRSGNSVSISTASATQSGSLSSNDWALFNSKQPALGYIPQPASANLSNAASATVNGYLTSNDWSTFNAKQSALGYIPQPASPNLSNAASATANGYLTSNDWSAFKQNSFPAFPDLSMNAGGLQYALVTSNNTTVWSPVSKWGPRKVVVAEYQNNPGSSAGYSVGWTITFAGGTTRQNATGNAHPYLLMYSPAVNGSFNAADEVSGLPFVPPLKNSYFEFRTGLTNTTNVRVWVGLAGNTTANFYNLQTPTTLHSAIFRYSTNSPNWFFITGDGSALTSTDTGVAASTNDIRMAVILNGGTQAVAVINGVSVATNATHLPSAALNPSICHCTLEAATKALRFYSIYGEIDW